MKGSYNGLKPKFEANLKSCAGQTMREQENVQNQTCEGIDHKF